MNTTVESPAVERVAAGVGWLDTNVPNWADRIELDRLDMGNRCNCMIGQLFGDYMFGPLSRREAMTMGFQRTADDGYGVLEAGWRHVIAERRGGAR